MNGWTRASLGEIARIERRGISPDEIPNGTKYLGLENISRGGSINGFQSIGEVTVASTKYTFTREHILYGKLRPNLGKIARPTFTGVCSTDILPVLPGPRVDRDYLAHFLSQRSMVDFATSRAAGANLPRLSPSELARFEVPLPPIEEQRRIAAILNHADALCTSRRRGVATLQSLTEATFWSLFGSLESEMVDPKCGHFGDHVTALKGGRNLVGADLQAQSAYRVLKISAVTSGVFRPSESKPLPPEYVPEPSHMVRRGDLLMSRANTTEMVGATALVEQATDSLALPDKIWRLVWQEPGRVEPLYMLSLLQAPAVRRAISARSSGTGGSMKNISKAKLMGMPLPVAPIEAQRDFVRRITRIRRLASVTETQLAEFSSLMTSIQHRAFSGRL